MEANKLAFSNTDQSENQQHDGTDNESVSCPKENSSMNSVSRCYICFMPSTNPTPSKSGTNKMYLKASHFRVSHINKFYIYIYQYICVIYLILPVRLFQQRLLRKKSVSSSSLNEHRKHAREKDNKGGVENKVTYIPCLKTYRREFLSCEYLDKT